MPASSLTSSRIEALRGVIDAHPGSSPVFVHLEGQERTTVLRLGKDHCVDASSFLYAELRVLLGAGSVIG